MFLKIFQTFISLQATLLRLNSLRLAVSHTYLYKKLDEFGKDHLHDIKEPIERLKMKATPFQPNTVMESSKKKMLEGT